MAESERDRMRRIATEAKAAMDRQERAERHERISNRLEQEVHLEAESRRELDDFLGEYLGASVDDIQAAFNRDMPDAQIMRDFKKIKRARGGRKQRLVKGASGRRVAKAYKARKKSWLSCGVFALALLGGALTLAGWGAYQWVGWV